jgi:hypothetical protein
MYPNSPQLGLAGQPVNYAHDTNDVLRTPAYKHVTVVFAVFVAVLVAGTTTAANLIAGKQVIYKPTANALASESNTASAQPASEENPQPAPSQQPAVVTTPPARDSSSKVQSVLTNWAASHSSQQWSVAVQGLGGDNRQAALNPNNKYDPASVFKLYFTYTLFQNYSLDSLSKNFVNVDGRGTVSMKDCLDQMIKNSDNPCGVAMGNRLGWGKTTKALKGLGILNTDLNNPSGLTTTAADINTFLQKLNAGALMPPDAQKYLMNLMQQQKYRSGIPAGCNGCVVADKIGDLGFVRHDVGIVQYPGGSYSLAIITNGAPYGQIAQLTSQIQSAISGN